MSVFDEAATEQQSTEPQAEQNTSEQQESFLKKLVEQRGEQWSDPEVIAKGKLEADAHISNLEKQLAELREDLGKNEYSKQLLEALQNKAGSANPNTAVANNDKGASDAPNTTADKEVDIQSLVEQTLTQRENAAKVAQNIQSVEEALTSAYGTEAQKVVKEKAEALGMSLSRMQEIASESPNAFLALMGEAPVKERNADVSSSRNTTAGFNNPGVKDFGYYQELRRKSPNEYYSPKVQNEMARAAVELGDRFYNK